jgi:hypothetical protein
VRAGLVDVRKKQSVADYPWSSVAGGYALPANRRPAWLACAEGLAAFDLRDDARGRRRFVERLDRRAVEEVAEKCGVPEVAGDRRGSHLRRGWYWGSQEFAERMLQLADRVLGKKPANRTYRSGAVAKAHGLKSAANLVREGLALAGLREGELDRLPGSDPRKVAIARAVWEETTVSLGWIAERLRMRSAANVSQILRRNRLGSA